jgi:hypothetical protein
MEIDGPTVLPREYGTTSNPSSTRARVTIIIHCRHQQKSSQLDLLVVSA